MDTEAITMEEILIMDNYCFENYIFYFKLNLNFL